MYIDWLQKSGWAWDPDGIPATGAFAVISGPGGRSVPACPGLVHEVGHFFLVQALYFVLLGYGREQETHIGMDPFEKAKMAAETILSRCVR